MGLTDWLARLAVKHAHVLVVEVPGEWRTRAAVERAALARGWRLALSPADADVLAVCGEPGPQLAEAVGLVWHQLPGPRVHVVVRRHDEAAMRLDEAAGDLVDDARHRDDARSRPSAADLLGDMDHGDMDHGDMEMAPGGIALAEGAEDRDGLEMDVLHVRLGPVLPYWPGGLVLDCTLHGDVVAEASAQVLDVELPSGPLRDGAVASPARRMDNLAALLALAGWDDAAAEARTIRDLVLDDAETAMVSDRVEALARRVRRSRVLRRSLRGVRPIRAEDLRRRGLPADLAGDTHDRLLRLLERSVRDAVAGGAEEHAAVTPDHLPEVLRGLDLAAVRLVVASLDLGELRTDRAGEEASHG